MWPEPETFPAYLSRLIQVTDNYLKDGELLSIEALNFHKGANHAYKNALKEYQKYMSNQFKEMTK